ncbi:nucleolar protein isoform X2 [Wolffia australiana]
MMASEIDSMAFKVKELIKDVKLDQSTFKIIDKTVASVVEAIRSTPESAVVPDVAPGFIRELGVPPEKIGFAFKSPESILVAGSRSINSMVKPDMNVDLLVRMPKNCFLEKDYKNHRYHARRCLYLHAIKEHLKSCPTVCRTSWSTLQNEARKPVLLVFPALEVCNLPGFFIRVIPAATSVFNSSRLSMSRNNVRAANDGDGVIARATPRYNSSILEDLFLEDNAEYIREVFNGWKNLEEALVLLKVWARNRSSVYAHDGINGYLLSVILSLLAGGHGGNLINKSMDALQIFRVTLKFIASSTSWTKCPSLKAARDLDVSEKELNRQLFDVVMLDVSGCANLVFRMRKAAFSELQDEASLALDCMSKCRDGGFEAIFMTRVDFPVKFDLFMRINMTGIEQVDRSKFCIDGEFPETFEERLHSVLSRALNDRAKLIRLVWRTTPCEWDIRDGFTKFCQQPVHVGVLFSSFDKSSRIVDIGPNADDKEEAAKFREFWGDKAELRRFKDGKIAESTVWECPLWKRHQVVQRIVQHVLSTHFSLSSDDVVQIVDQLDFSLSLGTHEPISFSGALTEAFEILSKRLRQLDGLPLKVSSVLPLDAALRSTAVFPPEPNPLADKKVSNVKSLKVAPASIQPIDVMIQLEGSGLWPLDEVAIEKTKHAWLLEIAKRFDNGREAFCVATEDEVDVMILGYAFRLRILHERGLKLMINQDLVKGVSSSDRELFLRSQHSSMINGLLGRFPVYGSVARLAKRWISCHLFSSFLVEEAVELLVANVFLNPQPFCAPVSRTTGFLRFLRLLANYDWGFSPLIVDINNDLTLEDIKQIDEAFILSRKSHEQNPHDIEPAMFLATSYDKTSLAWTKSTPTTSMLKRLASYARCSAALMTNLCLKSLAGAYTWECLFKTPLNNYDAVILLHKDRLSYPQRLLFPTDIKQGEHVVEGKPSSAFHPYLPLKETESLEATRNKLMVGFDPTKCLVEELQKEFVGTFKLWYDSLGADAMGLTWVKQGSKKRERDGMEGDENTAGGPYSILKEVGVLGKGFVKSVYLLKAPRHQL